MGAGGSATSMIGENWGQRPEAQRRRRCVRNGNSLSGAWSEQIHGAERSDASDTPI
jgi:hypothetical protein